MRDPHNTVELTVSGHLTQVDEGIVDLIRVLNRIPGIETTNSCEGGDPAGFQYGYVQFRWDESIRTDGVPVRLIVLMTERMNGAWDRYGREMETHYRKHGRHPKGREFHFAVEMGDGYILRWAPQTYPDVLSAALYASGQLS